MAPLAHDINWEDLGVTDDRRRRTQVKTLLMYGFITLVSFGICVGVGLLKSEYNYLPVLGIAVANMISKSAGSRTSSHEYHDLKSVEESSQSIKLGFTMTVLTVLVYLALDFTAPGWYKAGGVVVQVTTLMCVSGIIPPLILLWDLKYKINGLTKRRFLDDSLPDWQEDLKDWNNLERPQQAQITKQIQGMLAAFQPSEFTVVKRYAVAIRTFMCCLIYSPLMPSVTVIAVLAFLFQYWIDKKVFLRWNSAPKNPLPASTALDCIRFLRWSCSLLLPIANVFFFWPSWSEEAQHRNNLFLWCGLSLVLGLLGSLIPRSFFICLARSCQGRAIKATRISPDSAEDLCDDYYKVQYIWGADLKYHKSQFLYALLPAARNPENLMDPAAADDGGGSPKTGHTKSCIESVAEATSDSKKEMADKIASGYSGSLGAGAGTDDDPVRVVSSADDDDKPTRDFVWEFDHKGSWRPFAEDCQDFIERKHQASKKGGRKSCFVETGGIRISIHFVHMTQKVGKNIRDIRRRKC